ncbi:MAG TPA: LysM peptidoglycan-binding domain-containing protein [bacterium]
MMSDMLVLYDNVARGAKKTIRNFFLVSLVIVFGIIILVIAFSQGWITVVVNPIGHDKPFEYEQENYFDQRNDESIPEYFQKNRLFDIVRHSVEPGETLIDLEKQYGTNWKVIQKLNRINDPIRLNPGEMIWVPVKSMPS